MIAFALMLCASSAAGWVLTEDQPSALRAYLRFAALLYVALAVSSIVSPALSETVGLIVSPCAVIALVLAVLQKYRHRSPSGLSAIALGIAAGGGMGAAVAGMDILAFAPLLSAVAALFVLAFRHFGAAQRPSLLLMASAISFAAGASSLIGSAQPLWPLLLFSAVGLLGVALALAGTSKTAVEARKSRHGRQTAPVRATH